MPIDQTSGPCCSSSEQGSSYISVFRGSKEPFNSHGEMRTEDDAVEFVGAGVHVGQQDAAWLQRRQKLGLSWLGKSGKELVGGLGNLPLQHCFVIDLCCNSLLQATSTC